MTRFISLAAIVLACVACSSDDVKDIITPPDAVSNHSSSQGLTNGWSSSSESLDMSSVPTFSSTSSQSSMAASSSVADMLSSEAASSSWEYTASSEAASSSQASFSSETASSQESSEPVSTMPDGAQLFSEQCASCHNLETNLPFQIGANLSFTELHNTISNTMPFNNSNHCSGECAMELAYYIEDMRL